MKRYGAIDVCPLVLLLAQLHSAPILTFFEFFLLNFLHLLHNLARATR